MGNQGNQERAKFGEDERNGISSGESSNAADPVNDSQTKRNKTMNGQIRLGYEETSFGRSMSQ